MGNIYIVTDGIYSDYGIVAVYERKEDAEYCVEHWLGGANRGGPRIETHKTNPNVADMVPGRNPYDVAMFRNGDTQRVRLADTSGWRQQEDHIVGGAIDGEWSHLSHEPLAYMQMFATDEHHAVKIANERRVRWIAEDKWPTRFDGSGLMDLWPDSDSCGECQ